VTVTVKLPAVIVSTLSVVRTIRFSVRSCAADTAYEPLWLSFHGAIALQPFGKTKRTSALPTLFVMNVDLPTKIRCVSSAKPASRGAGQFAAASWPSSTVYSRCSLPVHASDNFHPPGPTATACSGEPPEFDASSPDMTAGQPPGPTSATSPG